MLQTFVKSCSREQLKFLSLIVSRRLPLQAADFTCELPRALSLYIFSFLDPRSLCRCAQVSRLSSVVTCGLVDACDLNLTEVLWTGELALEEHRGVGPAVDAQVFEVELVHQSLADAF